MKLKFLTNCPLCGYKYDENYFRVVDKKDGVMTLYLNCPHCKSSVMVALTMSTLGMSSVSMITDVTEKELDNFNSRSAISINDVLDIHNFLEGNVGN